MPASEITVFDQPTNREAWARPAPENPAAAAALFSNKPFPEGAARLRTSAPNVEVGFYSSAEELRRDLAAWSDAAAEWSPRVEGARRYVALFQRSTTARSASRGLAPNVSAGLEVSQGGLRAAVRAYREEPPSRDAVAHLARLWNPARPIRTADDLEPGVFLFSEVEGRLGFELDARYGYDVTWIRNVPGRGLTGDVGLGVRAGGELSAGFDLSGHFVLVVGRESLEPSDRRARLRLFKSGRRARRFALNASAEVSPRGADAVPSSLDDFVRAVLGVHGARLVEDLRALSEEPLDSLAGDFLADWVEKRLAGEFGGDLARAFEEGRARAARFIRDWDALGSAAAGALWEAVGVNDRKRLDSLRAVLREFSAEGDDDLARALRARMARPAGRDAFVDVWPAGLGSGGWLDAVENREIRDGVREASRVALRILDGGVLDELTAWAGGKLALDALEKADLATLDRAWRRKLSEFLGKPLDAAGLERTRAAVAGLKGQADRFYAASAAALRRSYGASLAVVYQKAKTKQTLIDATFDFGVDPAPIEEFRRAMRGDFGDLARVERPGVALNGAVLTHGIERRKRVAVRLPYYSSTAEHVAESLARLTVRGEDGGLTLYDLKAKDEHLVHGRWASGLAASIRFPAGAGASIRRYRTGGLVRGGSEAPSGEATYSFRAALPGVDAARLERRVEPLVERYFPRVFGVGGSETLQDWTIRLSRRLSPPPARQDDSSIGNALLTLRVELPNEPLAHWLRAPAERDDPAYLRLSAAVQRALRDILPFVYFQDAERYEDLIPAWTMLVYAALPVSGSIRLSGNKLTLNTGRDAYWDFVDRRLRRAMILSSATSAALARGLARARATLSGRGASPRLMKRYQASQLETIRRAALDGHGEKLLAGSLLFVEAEVIRAAVSAGVAFARFVRSGDREPAEALEALAEAGAELTKAFHRRLKSVFNPKTHGDLLRNLGALVMLEASRALGEDGGVQRAPAAMLEVAVLADSAPSFPPPGFLEAGDLPDNRSSALTQRVFSRPDGE